MDRRERISQTDAVVEELKKYFLSDCIQAGDKLPTEKMLCEMYSVGRSTVREAVRTLQVMGYVEIRPGRGAFLAAKRLNSVDSTMAAWISDNKPGLEETVRIRMAMESLAVRFAIAHATDAELETVDRARQNYENALARKNFSALPALDEAFHRAIVSASHSELLATLNSVVGMAFREWRDRSFLVKSHAANAVMPHQKIAAAILARDEEMAELQMRRHLERVLTDMSEGMSVRQER